MRAAERERDDVNTYMESQAHILIENPEIMTRPVGVRCHPDVVPVKIIGWRPISTFELTTDARQSALA